MISLQGNTHIFIALGPTDMRKGFDALAAIVAHSLKRDPLSGKLFLFFNRRRDKSKRTERSELVCPVGGGRLGPAEHPVEHFTLRVANDR